MRAVHLSIGVVESLIALVNKAKPFLHLFVRPPHPILHLPLSEGVITTMALLRWKLTFLTLLFCDQNLPKLPKPIHSKLVKVRFIVSQHQPLPQDWHWLNNSKKILSKSVTLATRPTSTPHMHKCPLLCVPNTQKPTFACPSPNTTYTKWQSMHIPTPTPHKH